MKAEIYFNKKAYKIDFDKPHAIGIELDPFNQNPSCFYAGQPEASPMNFNGYICSREAGAPVNFYRLNIVPHGHGTHTESVGHITTEFQKVNRLVKNPFMLAEVITITPERRDGDRVVTAAALDKAIRSQTEALVIRTRPNAEDKLGKDYTETNPPYLATAAMELIVSKGYNHLLLDLPSVDKEKDEGAIINHKLFWNVSGELLEHKTITEMIFVPNEIADGMYVLQLNIANMALDAVPSNPVLFDILNEESN